MSEFDAGDSRQLAQPWAYATALVSLTVFSATQLPVQPTGLNEKESITTAAKRLLCKGCFDEVEVLMQWDDEEGLPSDPPPMPNLAQGFTVVVVLRWQNGRCI